MAHQLVLQLRSTRSEFVRGLDGVSSSDGARCVPPVHSISWIVGHLAWQEQHNWLTRTQGQTLLPALNELVAPGQPATTPALSEMWSAWHTIVAAVDPYLDMLTTATLQQPMLDNGQPGSDAIGTVLQRQIYHYWYHLGEALAIRHWLGHTEVPLFIGDLHSLAPFQPG